MYAPRLWWMLRWLGHDAVAVLDGGIAKWKREGRPVTTEIPAVRAATFTIRRVSPTVSTDDVLASLGERFAPARRCARRRALSRRRRADRSRRRAHSGLGQSPVHRRTSNPTERSRSPRRCARSSPQCRRRRRPRRSSTRAARVSARATTCSRWSSPGSRASGSIQARGASGAPTRRAPLRAGRRKARPSPERPLRQFGVPRAGRRSISTR